jgi:hypothetical protein
MGLLAACAASIPSAKFELLAESTSSVAMDARDTFARVQRLQRKFVVAVLPTGAEPLTVESFKPAIDGRSFDFGPELAFRQAALQVFADYAAVLRALSAADPKSDIDTSTQKLGASLRALSSHVPTGATELSQGTGIFSTALDALARDVARRKQLEGLKAVMDKAQPDLDKLGALVAKSNDKVKAAVSVMLDRILARANRHRPPDGAARDPFDTAVGETIQEAQEIKSALDSIGQAATAYPKAHAELRTMLDDSSTTYEALQMLVQQARDLGDFYHSLGESNNGT